MNNLNLIFFFFVMQESLKNHQPLCSVVNITTQFDQTTHTGSCCDKFSVHYLEVLEKTKLAAASCLPTKKTCGINASISSWPDVLECQTTNYMYFLRGFRDWIVYAHPITLSTPLNLIVYYLVNVSFWHTAASENIGLYSTFLPPTSLQFSFMTSEVMEFNFWQYPLLNTKSVFSILPNQKAYQYEKNNFDSNHFDDICRECV